MKKANGKSHRGHIGRVYSSYMFKTKDPVIDELRTITEGYFGNRVNGHDLKQVEDAGGPSASTMRAWYFGKTKRPTSATLEAAGRSMGFKRKWIKMGRNEREDS